MPSSSFVVPADHPREKAGVERERHDRLGGFGHGEVRTLAIHRDGGRRDEERAEGGLVEISPASAVGGRTVREAEATARTTTRGVTSVPSW